MLAIGKASESVLVDLASWTNVGDVWAEIYPRVLHDILLYNKIEDWYDISFFKKCNEISPLSAKLWTKLSAHKDFSYKLDINTAAKVIADTNDIGIIHAANIQVEDGTVSTPYKPFSITIREEFLPPLTLVDNSVSTTKIQNGAVTPDRTSFFGTSKNLFNMNDPDIIRGSFISGASTTLGSIMSNASYSITGYIPISDGQTLICNKAMVSGTFGHNIYDANRTKIGTVSNSSTVTYISGAAFIRFSLNLTATADIHAANIQVEDGTMSTPYVPFRIIIQEQYLPESQIADDSITTQKLANFAVIPVKTNFIRNANLFNPATVNTGVFVNWTNGNLQTNVLYDASDYMEVEPSKPYILNPGTIRYMAWYDANKSFISGNQTAAFPLTSPENARYARVTVNTGATNVQFEQNTVPSTYVPFGTFKLGQEFLPAILEGNKLNRKWTAIGDSITAQGRYFVPTQNALGIPSPVQNLGVGGRDLGGASGMWIDDTINSINTDSWLITLMGGTNDWAHNRQLGTVDSFDTNTYMGALNTFIQKVTTLFPDKRLIVMSPPYGELYQYESRGWPNAYTNTLGLTTIDYAEAARQVAEKRGIPFCPIAQRAGWNTNNIRTFITDDGGLLHPLQTGGNRIASVLVGTINSILPITETDI